jgi:hypothetical protein
VKPADVAVVDAFALYPTGEGEEVHAWVAEVLTRQGRHEIVEGLRAKSDAGTKKYGRRLTDWNGDALVLHAAQESLDKLHYLGGALMNANRVAARVAELVRAGDTADKLESPALKQRRAVLHNQFWAEVESARTLLQLCAEINP